MMGFSHFQKDFGAKVKKARIKRKFSQEQLAALVDVSPSHISRLESGQTMVSGFNFVKICNVLKLNKDDFALK